MNSDRWQQIKEVLDATLKRMPTDRIRFLAEACRNDPELRSEVESFLSSFDGAENFLENPAVGEVAEAIVSRRDKLTTGQSLGHYKIIEQIGTGGMGEVYLAEDTSLHRQAALKVLPENIASNKERLRRFEQEAFAVSALNHPNILTIFEFGTENEIHFLASEFVRGKTLREKLNFSLLTLHETLDFGIQIGSALQAAHKAGIIHRDVKPENVMIREDSLVKVLDFGLAKLIEKNSLDKELETQAQVQTQSGMILGTARYMSPEQARGKEIDERTDIFSFGVILYEMLSGKSPFDGDSSMDTISSILHKEPPSFNQEIPPELQHIVEKCLRKDRESRYQTTTDLLVDLKDVKQNLDFQNKLERTSSPNREKAKTQSSKVTKDRLQTTSSAEYVISEIKRNKSAFIAAPLILLLVIGGFSAWYFTSHISNDSQIQSIAVLPFVNESGNADSEYLSDGMTETLISSLSQLPHLSVKARSSVFRYKDKEVSPQIVGNELNVQAVLNGRVIKQGDQLTLSLEIVDAKTENVIWSEQYNRKEADLVSLQSEIALDVSNKLRMRLSGAEQQKLTKNYTENVQAYQLYLKGRYFWNKFTPADQKKALEYFNQAIATDPGYALAYAGLADTYGASATNGWIPSKEGYLKGKTAAKKSLELDDTLAQAHTSLGAMNMFSDFDWQSSEREYKHAIELNPNYEITYELYSYLLSALGRPSDAIAMAQRGLKVNPLSIPLSDDVATANYFARQYDQAIKQLNKTLEIEPNDSSAHIVLGNVYEQKGMYEEAIAEYQNAISLSERTSNILGFLGHAYVASGKRTEAVKILNEMKEISNQKYISPYDLAILYTGLGEKDKAFEQLSYAYEEQAGYTIYLKVEPLFDPLRSDPRFQDFLRRIDLDK